MKEENTSIWSRLVFKSCVPRKYVGGSWLLNPYDYPMRASAAKAVQKDTRPWAHLLLRIRALSRSYQYPQQFHQFRLEMRNSTPLCHTTAIHRLLCRLTSKPLDKRVLCARGIVVLSFSKEALSPLFPESREYWVFCAQGAHKMVPYSGVLRLIWRFDLTSK